MKLLLAAALVMVSSLVSAEEGRHVDGVWVYRLPVHPEPPPRCQVLGGSLVCTGPVDDLVPAPSTKPSNCRWSRKGYVCW
jgi:hypothetical protein